jgi:NADP-reducing hydrogenase subunit HndB
MAKLNTIEDLNNLIGELKSGNKKNSKSQNQKIQVKVSMATCGMASGAKEIMDFFIDEFEHQAIDGEVTQTGCMGYCYAEPTIEVVLPGKESLIFGDVTKNKAREIVDKYIKVGELVDGILPVNYNTIDD